MSAIAGEDLKSLGLTGERVGRGEEKDDSESTGRREIIFGLTRPAKGVSNKHSNCRDHSKYTLSMMGPLYTAHRIITSDMEGIRQV